MATRTLSEPPERTLVSLVVAAGTFGVSVKTLRRRISDGTIHGYRVGRLIRVDLNELHERLLVEMPSAMTVTRR